MRRPFAKSLHAILVLLLAGNVVAESPLALFDGESLSGWSAPEMSYWSVENDAITARCSEGNPCTKNQFLVWQGGEIGDFVLELDFKMDGGPKANSGIQIRSALDAEGHAVGYQVDISQPTAPYLGAIYDEHGRKMLAERGEIAVVRDDGEVEKKSTVQTSDRAVASYDAGGWNHYEIIARGNVITVKLNGHLTSQVTDLQVEEREARGILALQLHSGPPMTVQFRNLVLTEIAASQ